MSDTPAGADVYMEAELADTRSPQTHSVTDEDSGSESVSDDLADADDSDLSLDNAIPARSRRRRLSRAAGVGVLSAVALLAVCGAAYLKYRNATDAAAETARVESVAAAKESAIAILSYTPDTAEASLTAARDRLTGTFRDSYSALIQNVVIPGAKEQHISATATVPAAATVSASADHAVALLFVNQAITVGNGTPSQSASVVQVSLERVDSRWLITGFDPK